MAEPAVTATPSRKPALSPAAKVYRVTRKRLHLLFFSIFVGLPFGNLMRFDLPRQRFYFAGFELGISEFSIIFFSLMFLMFLIAASAIVYGRIYCSYACPQMIFSEWSVAVQRWAARLVQNRFPRWPARRRQWAGQGLFYAVLALASVALAFVFTSYFLEPKDLLIRLLHLDLATVAGITGASVTLLTFLDLTLVRHTFCTTVCPYGYLQGMLQDQHTLLVRFDDPDSACIQCQKCVRVCEMGIDIRKSPLQIECVHCGDCVDACEEVLRKVGHEGLIHYTYGDRRGAGAEPWAWRIGLRDGKRWVLLGLLLVYLGALGTALALRRPVRVTVTADRAVLYQVLGDGRILNRIRFNAGNRSSHPAEVRVWLEGLADAELVVPAGALSLAPGQSVERIVDLRVKPWPGAQDVNRFRIWTQATGDRHPEVTELTFIMPVKGE